MRLETLGLSPDNLGLVDLCVAIDKDRSKGVVRRLIQAGGISVEDTKITDANYRFATIADGIRLLK